jgi:hypothetical protein
VTTRNARLPFVAAIVAAPFIGGWVAAGVFTALTAYAVLVAYKKGKEASNV